MDNATSSTKRDAQSGSNTTANRVAIVTGSSRGIGAAVVKRLAADGFAVIVNYAGRAADAEQVVQEIRDSGGQTIAVKADVSSPADINALFDQAEAAFGGVDVVVNNAGIIAQPSPVESWGLGGKRPRSERPG